MEIYANALAVAVLEVDEQGDVVQANAKAAQWFKLDLDEMSGADHVDCLLSSASTGRAGQAACGEGCCDWCGMLPPGVAKAWSKDGSPLPDMLLSVSPRAGKEKGHVLVLQEMPAGAPERRVSWLQPSQGHSVEETKSMSTASAKAESDIVGCGTISLDKELRIVGIPNSVAGMLEFTSCKELVGQKLDSIINKPSRGFATDAQQRLHTGHTKTGKKLQFALAIRPKPSGDGFEATLSGVTRTGNQRMRILASIAAPAVVTDRNMRIVFINSACTDVFGYSVDELLGRNVTVLMPRKLATRHDKFVARFEKSGDSRIIGKKPRLVEGRSKLGEKLKLLLTITANDGEGYTAVFTDVTEQHQHSETLESILQSMMSPVVMTDRSMRISFVNRYFTEVFGYLPDEVLGQNVKVLMDDDEAARHDSYVHNYEATKVGKIIGKPKPRPVVGRHKKGSPLRLGLTLTPNGNRGYTALFTVESDDAKRGRQLQDILLSIKAPVVHAKEDLTITFVNPDFTHVFGYTAEEVIGKNVTCLMKPAQAAQHHSYVERFKLTNMPRIIGAAPRLVRGQHKKGTDLHLYLTITHAAEGFTAVFTDVTEGFEHKERADRIASVSAPVFITDCSCNIEFVNECAVKFFQCETSEDLVGKNISSVLMDVHGQHHPDFFAGMIPASGDGAETCEVAAPQRAPEGRPIIRGRTQRGKEVRMYCSVSRSNSGYTIVFMDVGGL